ncbi:hypothetical protein VitviT2T_014840 [Vitis vinifera]|uniref:Uncharacterized protein n=1 Tax=Vitis vinifera TaxID=29760 RepID=A0ABY9CLQ1_VITVI|nr:hypothetical protein VitviT2T_014840 [Vitis vinifera]
MEDDEVGGNGELTSETHKESHLPAAFSGVYTSAQVRDIFEIELDQDNSSDRDGASTILEETESISVGEVMKSPFFSENESSDNSFWIDLGHNPMGFDYASQASLLSFLPADLLKISEIPRLTANAFTLLIRWFHDNFRVRSPSSAERPLHSSLAFAPEAHEGTSEKVAALSVALFRALNLTTRFVSILDVAPLKLGTHKSKSAIQNANRASKGIFDNSTLMVAEKEKIRFPSLLLNHPHAMARATSVNLLKTMHVQIRILNQQEKLLSLKILQSLIN